MSAADAGTDPTRRRRPRQEPTPAQRAVGLLTRREHSRRELERKLVQRGVEPDEASAVVGRLADAGWQDDARFAESLLRARASAGYGPAWIRAELKTHDLPGDLIAMALEAFEDDWIEFARNLLRRRQPHVLDSPTREDRRKALDLLLRRGFSMEQGLAALDGGDRVEPLGA